MSRQPDALGKRRLVPPLAFALANFPGLQQSRSMKSLLALIAMAGLSAATAWSTTITVVPIFEPISLHGTDGDEAISEIGEALQASVMSRPMALTGAFPEVLVDAIRSPHLIPTNNPNYKIQEANLLVLCNIGISGEIIDGELTVRLDISELAIPADVDLTTRQILNLAIIALRKTLDAYQGQQIQPLTVNLLIEGAEEGKAALRDLSSKFEISGAPAGN